MSDMFFHVNHPLFDAIILRQGAQLIHFQPKGDGPILWSAKLSTFEKGKAFRGGIPICWPWFGKMGNPSHGFARIMTWELIKHSSDDEGMDLIFELGDSAKTREIWPYAFKTTLKMHLGRDISISLHVNAQKQSTAALHSYLTCKDILDVNVEGLGANYNDALIGGAVCESHEKALHVSCAVDRIYTHANEITLLKEHEKTLSIAHQNHSDVVVWNPWKEGAMQLADMKEEDYTKMLCIETARISKPLTCDDSLHVRIF